MTDPVRPITDEDLNAYTDGRLDPARREEVEAYLEENQDAAARVASYRIQNAQIREAFDPILDEKVPEDLIQAVTQPAGRWWVRPQAIAAGIALFIAGGLAGWGGNDLSRPELAQVAEPHFTRYAVSAHRIYTREVRHAVEVPANQEKHLVRWLSKRLGHQLKVPGLQSVGFELVGGRLLATPDDGRAAQFMFEDAKKRRLTLYVRSSNQAEQTAFRYEQAGEGAKAQSMFYWIDQPFAYALIGPLKRDELLKISTAVYEQISP